MSDAPLVARVSRARVLRHTLMMLTFTGALALMLTLVVGTTPADYRDWGVLLFGWGVVLMFLYGTFYIGRALFHRGEIIVVDAEGIRIPSCYQGLLPWNAIDRADVLRGRLHFWLAKDAVLPPGKGLDHVLRTNRAIRPDAGGPDMAVTTWLADRSTDELVAAVRSQAPQLFA